MKIKDEHRVSIAYLLTCYLLVLIFPSRAYFLANGLIMVALFIVAQKTYESWNNDIKLKKKKTLNTS